MRVLLVAWEGGSGDVLANLLRGAGFAVDHDAATGPEIFRSIRESPPDAVVIDLSRLPSHGREVATALRGNRKTRELPLVFVDGAAVKVDAVRKVLPDAVYCTREELAAGVTRCLQNRPENPVVPTQMMERYAGRTSAQKLGITADSRVAVMNAPRDYARVIGVVPEGVEFDEEGTSGCGVAVWFVESPEELLAAIPRMRRAAVKAKLWVAWPKKAARPDGLLNENIVRDLGLEAGLVDYKVCSINPQWSGLCFALRKAK